MMKFTIITVVFNGQKYLKETIESVISQTYKNIEYIIIDGGSSDGTIDIIKEYEIYLSYWQSESDKSMYDAINKGLSFSTGEFILILNSDDQLFHNTTIAKMAAYIQKEPNYLAYYGQIVKLKENKQIRKWGFQCSYNSLLFSQHCSFIPHPALFVNKIIAKNFTYNINYRYASDFDYILNLSKVFFIKYIPLPITLFREHPESITSSGKLNSERLEILKLNSLFKISFICRQFHFYKIWFYYKILQIIHA
ncbi:MAG: glycosyltransferase family 2 protein [Spirosomataceae bacterium]